MGQIRALLPAATVRTSDKSQVGADSCTVCPFFKLEDSPGHVHALWRRSSPQRAWGLSIRWSTVPSSGRPGRMVNDASRVWPLPGTMVLDGVPLQFSIGHVDQIIGTICVYLYYAWRVFVSKGLARQLRPKARALERFGPG